MAGAPCHAHILWVPHIDVERPSGNLLAPAKNKKEGRQSHARPKLCKLQLLRLSPAPALKICYETIDEDLKDTSQRRAISSKRGSNLNARKHTQQIRIRRTRSEIQAVEGSPFGILGNSKKGRRYAPQSIQFAHDHE
eukprot:6206097-Pleurochrysis_carterae.AAC.3